MRKWIHRSVEKWSQLSQMEYVSVLPQICCVETVAGAHQCQLWMLCALGLFLGHFRGICHDECHLTGMLSWPLAKVTRILGESWRDCLEAAGRRTHLEKLLSCLGLLKSVTCSKEIHSNVFFCGCFLEETGTGLFFRYGLTYPLRVFALGSWSL